MEVMISSSVLPIIKPKKFRLLSNYSLKPIKSVFPKTFQSLVTTIMSLTPVITYIFRIAKQVSSYDISLSDLSITLRLIISSCMHVIANDKIPSFYD